MAEEKTAVDEEKKPKKRNDYHLMLFIDSKDGGVKQMGIDRGVIDVVVGVVLIGLIASIIGWAVNSHLRKSYIEKNEMLTRQVESLKADVATLEALNTELSGKVTILSDTVNTKVEQQNAIQEESDAAHYPEGFPLSSSASMSTDEEDDKRVIFNCNEGTSVIASGAGTVLEVLPDTEYGYCVRIDHENGYVTEYYMSSTPLIKESDSVLQGAILALVDSNNTKVAYKVYLDGEQIDPMDVIKIDG